VTLNVNAAVDKISESLNSIADIATAIGGKDVGDLIRTIPVDKASHFISGFIEGAKAENFSDLIKFIPELKLPDKLEKYLTQWLRSTKITRIKYDNSEKLAKLQKEKEAASHLTEVEKEKLQLELNAIALKTSHDVAALQAKIEAELSEIAKIEIPEINTMKELFGDPSTRDIIVDADADLRAKAIAGGALQILPDGQKKWLI